MAQREHDSLEPYEPSDPGYDWDYEPEDHGRNLPNIMWGRVAVLGAVVLLAFFFGRMTSGGGGVSQERYDAARSELRETRAEISTLQTQVEDLEGELAADSPEEDPEGQGDADQEQEQEAPPADSEVYVVQAGDTLTTIAEDFYKDASLADFIAEANSITDASQLSVGAEIIIPPKPE
jgi:nucleoid-associated protein YgaU